MRHCKSDSNGATAKLIPRRHDVDAQKSDLKYRKERLRDLIIEEGKPHGVFCGFKGLSSALLAVLQDIEPLDNLRTASEDRKRCEIFDEIVRVMSCHMRLQNRIVRSKK